MANLVKDGALGTVKGFFGKGAKGMLIGAVTALVIGSGAGFLAAGALAAFGAGAAAMGVVGLVSGVAATVVSFGPSVMWGGSIGATYGTITGGKKEMNKTARAEAQSLEVAQAQANYRIEQAQEKNMNVRHAISGKGQQAPREMYNPMAEGKAADHYRSMHQSKFAANKAAQQGQAQGGMSK